MRLIVFLVLSMIFNLDSFSQNLLPNGSFEDENICTEFHQKCSPSGWVKFSIDSPIFINCYAADGTPFDGMHFIKIIAANNKLQGVRTFMTSRLLCGLREKSKYNIEFYYRSSHPAVDSIGIYLSSTDFLYENRPCKDINPTSWITRNNADEANSTWIKASCVFTATGNENFFTIGTFKRDDFVFYSAATSEQDIYLYLDKVSLIPIERNERICETAESIRYKLYMQNDRHSRLVNRRLSFLNHPLPSLTQPKTIVLKIDTLTMTDISFESGRASLSDECLKQLDGLFSKINKVLIDSVVIQGHTDSIGSFENNQTLSEERSLSVSNYIQPKLGLSSEKVVICSFADKQPAASNKTLEGRRKNRRVEIFIYSHL